MALFSLDRDKLASLATANAAAYRDAHPFPHVVLDDFLPVTVLDDVLGEFPSPQTGEWFRFDSDFEKKLATEDGRLMGHATGHVLGELNGAAMLDFLQDLTGIEGLVPDPHFIGGGLHQIEAGGFLEVHADFNLHPVTGLYRRLNLLLYLNRDWQPEWGGALELWDRSMSRSERSIEPLLNRCVIFNTSDRSFHGHPQPVSCPAGVTRKSLALYYYARQPDPEDTPEQHNTLFQHRDGGKAGVSRTRRIAHDVLPPAVMRAAHRLRTRRRRD